MPRTRMLNNLLNRLVALRRGHTLRVGVDGPGASGKTTLANELAEALEHAGRPVVRATIDGFHHPRAHRTRQGGDSVSGYYEDSFDHHAVRTNVLEPLGPGGDGVYRKAVFDFRVDSPVDEPWHQVSDDAVLIFDGMFLFRPELNNCWDFRIFVHADFHITLERACVRDRELFGSDEETRRRYHARYIPGQRYYIDTVNPHALADVVIFNNEPHRPGMQWAAYYESDGK
jgi:uridine kinase